MIFFTILFSFPFMKKIIWSGKSQEPVRSVVAIILFPSVVQRIQTMSWICRVRISPKDGNQVYPLHFVVYNFGTRWKKCAVNLLHSSLGFLKHKNHNQFQFLLNYCNKSTLSFFKISFSSNYCLVKTLLLKKNSLRKVPFVGVLSGAYNILP